MTRLDATSEPSMEDILASIRKIIAEDPPGSRPALTPSAPSALQAQNAAPQQSLRAPERDPFSTFARRNDDAASTPGQSFTPSPEPYLKPSPQKPAASEFANEPFFAPRSPASSSSFDQATSAPSRIEPSFGPRSSATASVPAAEVANEPAAPAVAASAVSTPSVDVSVDAQLSDLLGETASVVSQPAAVTAAPIASSPAPGFGDRMAGRSAPSTAARADVATPLTPSETSDARPGFTVSRDGFVAAPDDAESPAEADPFEFDLGPSPFLAKPDAAASMPAPAPAPTGNSLTARMSASSLERISAPSVAATVADASAIQIQPEPAKPPQTATAPQDHVAPAAPLADVAAPSVAATLAPASFEPTTPETEPIGRFIPANASVEAPKTVDRDVLEVVAPKLSAADSAPIEVVRVAAEVDTPEAAASTSRSSSTAIAVHHAEGHMRTMEETVAELLRPMLKSWLAENMPRIVERALRRELAEQMMLDKKDAAE